MIKLGITGGIASGKSVICKVFETLGVPIYNADNEVKNLYDTDMELKNAMIATFGATIYTQNRLDRKALASIIFDDAQQMKVIGKLVYPVVKRHFLAWANTHAHLPYVVQEAAILFESGSEKMFDYIININAPVEMRIAKACKRDQASRSLIELRIQQQLSDEQRALRSDMTLINDGSHALFPEIFAIHKKIINGDRLK